MPATFTKAQASRLLNATEMKLFEDSRIRMLRSFSASQLDRRVIRMRDLRDRARDLLKRQNLAERERTGSKHGVDGHANERSGDKLALLTDMLHRFEGQLESARRKEAEGTAPDHPPARRVTRKVAKTRITAPDKDFTAARMRSKKRDAEEAADIMRRRDDAHQRPQPRA